MDGLLLAAGGGIRMGLPKALMIDSSGLSWLARSVETLLVGGMEQVTVVLGARSAEARPLVPENARIVVARNWSLGMAQSLRVGLTALPDNVRSALVHFVDLPDISAAVVRRVASTGDSDDVLARATFAGKPGHPVLIGRDHWPGILETSTGDEGARRYLRDHRPTLVECGDLATGHDVDRPA